MEINSVKTSIIAFSVIALSAAICCAQPPDTLWTRTYGNPNYSDWGNCVQMTQDGGYIITGMTQFYNPGSDIDVWLIKTNAEGYEEWNQVFGGDSPEDGYCVQQTEDGGYIIVGWTQSYGVGNGDIWLIKTDSLGLEEWNNTFGGGASDVGWSVEQTSDGGYVIAGHTESFGAGYCDLWLIKTDLDGNEEWSHTFGGSYFDSGHSVKQTDDGGYIIAGESEDDVWLLKTDVNGNYEWDQTFGGEVVGDGGKDVSITADGGFIIAGYTWSFGAGESDVWLIKTDSLGNEQWNRTFGGSEHDFGNSVQQTSDGGYVIAGYTESFGAGWNDYYVIKTDSEGNIEWEQVFGGTSQDEAKCVLQNSDTEYIIVGFEQSSPFGDIWMICLEGLPLEIELLPLYEPIFISPWGGNFGYYVRLSSYVEYEQICDVWIDILLPDSSLYGPVLLREDIIMQPLSHVQRLMIQEVPAVAPPGRYINQGHIGDYSIPEIWSEDAFAFTKVGYDNGPEGESVSGWSLSGWTDPEDIATAPAPVPNDFSFFAYPNPFNPTTTIRFTLLKASQVELAVYDISGRHVGAQRAAPLINGWRGAGTHEIIFDGSDLASGIYIYRVKAGEFTASGKMLLLK